MGCWGMGITQSDEYCEVYESFMEEYDNGRDVADISGDMLNKYFEEFDENDGILHDVYFALGKAEWMCGGISEPILKRICEIVKGEENITFLRELDATEADLRQRSKNLEKFLQSLSVPRNKVRKRKKKGKTKEEFVIHNNPALPQFEVGDVFAYKNEKRYRIFSLTRRAVVIKKDNGEPYRAAFAILWQKKFDDVPEIEDLKNEQVIPLGYFTGGTLPEDDEYVFIGNMSELKVLESVLLFNRINELWKPVNSGEAKVENLTEDIPPHLYMSLGEMLKRAETAKGLL